nr:PREDICTED: vicilin-like antimicrobial peptides 2-3 [Daucus carota subsp. sativus]
MITQDILRISDNQGGSVDSAHVKQYVDDATSVSGQGSGSASGVESDNSVSNLSITPGGLCVLRQNTGESENKINILRQNHVEPNEFGELCEIKPREFRPLEDFDVTVSFANITHGGMSTIFFDSKAIKIFVVMNGAGQLEMACLHLAQEHGQGQQGCSGFQEGQGQQGHRGSQEQEQEKKSTYRRGLSK